MKYFLIFQFSILYHFVGYNQTITKTCNWEIPGFITMDCNLGNDYQFEINCSCELNEFTLFIYNRWAEVVFETNDIKNYWNASKNTSDRFIYVVTGKYNDGTEFKKTGTVILQK
jgi:hypothetical protein